MTRAKTATVTRMRENGRTIYLCTCGSKNFSLIEHEVTEVDFSREGAIKDYPFVKSSAAPTSFDIMCNTCGRVVPRVRAEQMRKSIL